MPRAGDFGHTLNQDDQPPAAPGGVVARSPEAEFFATRAPKAVAVRPSVFRRTATCAPIPMVPPRSHPHDRQLRFQRRAAEGVQKAGLLGDIEHFLRDRVAFACLDEDMGFDRVGLARLAAAPRRAAG